MPSSRTLFALPVLLDGSVISRPALALSEVIALSPRFHQQRIGFVIQRSLAFSNQWHTVGVDSALPVMSIC